jgi:hypothetical protein
LTARKANRKACGIISVPFVVMSAIKNMTFSDMQPDLKTKAHTQTSTNRVMSFFFPMFQRTTPESKI